MLLTGSMPRYFLARSLCHKGTNRISNALELITCSFSTKSLWLCLAVLLAGWYEAQEKRKRNKAKKQRFKIIEKHLSEHVVEIIQDSLPDHCTICGWSLGGQIAMGLALANPLSVKKLILVSTTPCFVKHPDWPWGMESKFLQFFMENLHQNFRTTINRFLTLQINGGRNSTNTLAQLREYFFERDQPDYNALQKGLLILQTNDMRSKLHRIGQPVLLLHGENDMITHPSAAKWMNQQLKNSRLVLFPKCGHAPFITDPERFVGCINEA